MAKVVMPLLSAEASGKIADTMVYFYWKGRNVVRRWVVPTNPRSSEQKRIRTNMASMGKNLKAIVTTGADPAIVTLVRAVTPSNQIWNAYFVKQTIDYIKTAANYTTLLDAFTAAVIPFTEFGLGAGTLGMEAILTGENYDKEVSAGFQLFLGAYAAYKLGLTGATGVYTKFPTNWETADITNFVQDYQSA